jgi:hypothetical protein
MNEPTYGNEHIDPESIQVGKRFEALGGTFTILERWGDQVKYLCPRTGEWNTDVRSFLSAHHFMTEVNDDA